MADNITKTQGNSSGTDPKAALPELHAQETHRKYRLIDFDQSEIERTTAELFEGSKLLGNRDLWLANFKVTIDQIRSWCDTHKPKIKMALVDVRSNKVLFYFVPQSNQYDLELGSEMTDLEVALGGAPALDASRRFKSLSVLLTGLPDSDPPCFGHVKQIRQHSSVQNVPTNPPPAVQRHVSQWKHNRQFVKSIDSKYRDWQITAVFYTALHAIDAALATLSVNVADHSNRNHHVKTNASFTSIRKPYLDLYRISRVTRYDADPNLWIPKQYLTVSDMIEGLLKPIENGLESVTRSAIKYTPINLVD